jgi:aminopeptidase N
MDALKRSMRWDEEVYGREYDLDVFNIVAVDDFNMGAMENKGLNIFNSVRAREPRDRDRPRLRFHRGHRRA